MKQLADVLLIFAFGYMHGKRLLMNSRIVLRLLFPAHMGNMGCAGKAVAFTEAPWKPGGSS